MKIRLYQYYFFLLLNLFFASNVYGQDKACDQKVAFFERQDPPDIELFIIGLKKFVFNPFQTFTPDCRRRLYYLLAICSEAINQADSARHYFGESCRLSFESNNDTAIIEMFAFSADFMRRNNERIRCKGQLDTALLYLKRYLRNSRFKYEPENAPQVYTNLDDPINTAHKHSGNFSSQFTTTQLHVLRNYHQIKANYLHITNQPVEAKRNALLAYEFARANPLDSTEGNILNNIGLYLSDEGLFHTAVDFFTESLLIAESQNQVYAFPNTLVNLSFCFRKMKKYAEAETYARRAYDTSLRIRNWAYYCRSASFLAKALASQNKSAEAEVILKKSLDTALKYNLTSELCYSNRSLAEILLQNKKPQEAFAKVNQSRNLAIQIGDSAFLAYTNLTTGNYYYQIQNYPNALKYAVEGLQYLEKYKDYADVDIAYRLLSLTSEKMNDFKMAYFYQKKYEAIKDSLFNSEVQLSLQSLERKYNSSSKELQITRLKQEQQEKEIQLQQKDNRIRLFTGIVLTSLLLALSILYFNRRLSVQKKQVEKANEQLEDITATQNRLFRIIAHDLKSMLLPFNRAGKIMNNYLGKNDSKSAGMFADKLEQNSVRISDTVSNLLFWSAQQLDGYKLKAELIAVKEQVNQVLDLFSELLDVKQIELINLINPSDGLIIDKGSFDIIIRNIVSNAIKFTDRGKILISANRYGMDYHIQVQDEGVGMSSEKLRQLLSQSLLESSSGTRGELGSGIGFSIIRKLVELNNGKLNIESKPGKGTLVNIYFNPTIT
jgi:signal transduction histidine kinase